MTGIYKKGKMFIYLILIALLLIVQGNYHIIRALRLIIKGRDSKNWPQTTARVIRSEVSSFSFVRTGRKKGRVEIRFVPEIEYEYKVNLVPYRSKQLFWMRNLIRNTFDEADDIASQYPLGMTLNVYYNPDKPNEAIWKTEDANKLWWEFVASLLELGVGIFFMYKAFNM